MKICFFTNTFLPHVGGVARSVQTFLEDYRKLHHRMLVVAPQFPEGPAPARIERCVERVPALQRFNGSDFSVSLPVSSETDRRIADFKPDLIHAHHPFLLGDTALRVGAENGAPVIFTHHTLYEQYTHYVPFDSPALKEFVIDLSTRFANRCQGVFAPSESVAALIKQRGVTVPVCVVPTGIDTQVMSAGDRAAGRRRNKIPSDAILLGHVGRLAPEKNLDYLTRSVARCLERERSAWFLVVGDGPSREDMQKLFSQRGLADRTIFAGKLTGGALRDAYAAMDCFAFASQSETQGMVLAEAMAVGVPVVALDAAGAREIVRDRMNGRLLPAEASEESFTRALVQAIRNKEERARWRRAAIKTAAGFDRSVTAARAVEFYREIIREHRVHVPSADELSGWDRFKERLSMECQLVADKVGAAVRAIGGPSPAENEAKMLAAG